MKIVFVNYGRENLGIEYLSSFLKTAGHQTSLANDSGLFSVQDNALYAPFLEKIFSQKKELIEKVKKINPDLVCFSVYTNNYQYMCEIAKEIKKTINAKIVFGGAHPTLVPEVVISNDFVDIVVVGEGEHTLLDIVNSLQSGSLNYRIKNAWIKKNGSVVKNELNPPADLDSLPWPDKDLFKDTINYRESYLIVTSRGCPNNCVYCGEEFKNRLYNYKFFRKRSVNSVMGELLQMKRKYNFKEVMFFDAIFFTHREWLKELMERYRKEINVPFRCFGEVHFFNEEIAKCLKRGGCYCIEFGLQTINVDIRGNILNRFDTNEQIKSIFDICDEHKLRYDIDHIFGLPMESADDFIEAAKFYAQLKYLNRIKCHNLTYFPKARILNVAIEKNILTENDIKNINNGIIGDFFHIDSVKDDKHRALKRDFWYFYKILPLLPHRLVKQIIKFKLYKKFYLIPYFIIIFAQIGNALRAKDLRFTIHANKYFYFIRKQWLKI